MTTVTKAVASLEFARELFTRGTDFFDLPEIGQVFGIEIPEADVPPIPFSQEELRVARKLDQVLVLQAPGVTVSQIHDLQKNKTFDGKPLFYNTEWYRGESFFTEDAMTSGWKLVSREVLPSSLGQDYLDQTATIVAHLPEIFGTEMSADVQAAIEEFNAQRGDIRKLMGSDWQKAAERLANLRVNQLFRQTLVEAMWLLALYEGINHERLLPNTWNWTNKRSSSGKLIGVGAFDEFGVLVNGDDPGDRVGDLGVSFSRSGNCVL